MKNWFFYFGHTGWITGWLLCFLFDRGWMAFDDLLPTLLIGSSLMATILSLISFKYAKEEFRSHGPDF